MVTLHEVITFLVSMQISISSLQTHNVNRCGRSRHLARKLSLRRKRSSPNVFEMAATETITSIILIKLIRVSLGTVRHPRRFKIVVIDIQIVNAANQVVSVGADIAFDADPKFFACLVRFESSSVPTTLPTAYDVYPLDGRHDGGYYTVKDCVTIDVLPRTPGNNVYVGFMVWSNFTATKCRGLVSLNQVIKEIICLQPLK